MRVEDGRRESDPYNPGKVPVKIDHWIPNARNAVHNGEDAAGDIVECFLAGLGMLDQGPLEEE